MQRRKTILVGNWKMNPPTLEEAKAIFMRIKRSAAKTSKVSTVICPSDVHLSVLARLAQKSKVMLGVQDVFWEDEGFFTGQISPKMAKNAGARYALLGHSERRRLGESNEQIAKKLEAVIRDGLIGIVCVGETERDRDGHFYDELRTQIVESLGRLRAESFKSSFVLAYEPVWEVGRSDMQAMKPSDVYETSIFIRKVVNDAFGAEAGQRVPILYGGSVSVENAATLVREGGVDGLLVGRQSLDGITFSEILKQLDSDYGTR